MIQKATSSSANFLSPITTGKGNIVNQLANNSTAFAQILNGGAAVSQQTATSASGPVSLESLAQLGYNPNLNFADAKIESDDPTAVNETTLNGKLPEKEPQTAEEAMQQFVGETFYGMMIKQMRSSVIKSDLMGNSNAEKMFESQFDQMMVERLAENSSSSLTKPMYEQMMRYGKTA